MATNVDLYIDSGGRGILSGGSAPAGTLPTLTRNDVYNFRILVQDAVAGALPVDSDLTGASIKLGIGNIDARPTSGQFNLTLAGPVTSSSIAYNATTTQLFNAISGIAGNATVTTYGTSGNAWIVTAATNNTALSFGGVTGTLFPTSSVLISTRRFPSTNAAAQQVIELRRSPAVYSDSFTLAATAGVISLSNTQNGSATANETYRLLVGTDAAGGSFVLGYGANSTTAIPIGSPSESLQSALSNISAISAGNISVVGLSNNQGYSISFVRSLGLQNITTALTLDASGVYFSPWRQATVTMATSELDELFAEEGETTITPTLEIEVSQSGVLKTICQQAVTVRKDLITTGSAIPSPQASYYTKSEVDAGFVEDSIENVSAASRELFDDAIQVSVAWDERVLYDSNATDVFAWGNGIGFYGTPPVSAKPSGSNFINSVSSLGLISYSTPTQANVVSNLVSAGLLSSSSTYGVLPGSTKTLTTTASIYFGQVNSNDTNSVSVTVTGCSINDIVLIGLPATIDNGLAFSGHVTTANGLEIDCINATNGNITPATATYRITVIGY